MLKDWIVPDQTFEYGGYHFIPVRQFREDEGDFFAITMRLIKGFQMGISTYDWRKADYSHDAFYEASTDKECDIFRCKENDKLYVPCDNELFEYDEPKTE